MPNRSKRLRKKLRLNEFVVLVFGVDIELADNLTPEQFEDFWNDYIADAIEANGLLYGGLETGVASGEKDNCTDVQRQQVADWLKQRAEVIRFKLGPLTDGNPPWRRRDGWADFDFETALQLDETEWVERT